MLLLSEIAVWIAFLIASYFLIFWLLVLLDEDPDKYTVKKKLHSFPLTSIVIPAYNEEESIADTLNSVINMEYPKDKLQILVINDGSTDNTKKITEEYINSHPLYNIKLITQKNKGKGAALNAGLKETKGEFFVCLDADSEPRKDTLKILLPYFDAPDIATVLPLMKLKETESQLQKLLPKLLHKCNPKFYKQKRL